MSASRVRRARRHGPTVAVVGIAGGFVWESMLWVAITALTWWLVGFVVGRDRWSF